MIFYSLWLSLVLTLVLELPLVLLWKIPLSVGILVNVLTNPVVVLLYHWAKYFQLPLIGSVVVLEVLAIWVEGYFYCGHCKRPWRFALLVNGISFSIGCLL